MYQPQLSLRRSKRVGGTHLLAGRRSFPSLLSGCSSLSVPLFWWGVSSLSPEHLSTTTHVNPRLGLVPRSNTRGVFPQTEGWFGHYYNNVSFKRGWHNVNRLKQQKLPQKHKKILLLPAAGRVVPGVRAGWVVHSLLRPSNLSPHPSLDHFILPAPCLPGLGRSLRPGGNVRPTDRRLGCFCQTPATQLARFSARPPPPPGAPLWQVYTTVAPCVLVEGTHPFPLSQLQPVPV